MFSVRRFLTVNPWLEFDYVFTGCALTCLYFGDKLVALEEVSVSSNLLSENYHTALTCVRLQGALNLRHLMELNTALA